MFFTLGIEVKCSEDHKSSELVKTVIYNGVGEQMWTFYNKGAVYEFYHNLFKSLPKGEKIVTYCYKLKRVDAFFAFGDIFPHDTCQFSLNNFDSRKVEEGMDEKTILCIDTDFFTFRDGFVLTKLDLEYMPVEREVKELHHHITKLMQLYNDDLRTIPLTSTKYAKRDLQRACRSKAYRKWFLSTKLSAKQYYMCLNAFKGALCFSNPKYRGKILKGNIIHRDFRSHYISQLRTRQFPIGKPEVVYDVDLQSCRRRGMTLSIDDILSDTDYTYVVELDIKSLVLKKGISAPILIDKDFYSIPKDAVIDNHHVIEHKGINTLFLDSVTLKWVVKQYDFEWIIKRAFRMKNGPLPQEYIPVIDRYFIEKSDKSKGDFEHEVDKQRLNAVGYGCFVQKPIRRTIKRLTTQTEIQLQKDLTEYYDNWSSFLPYQIGIMVASYARDELLEYIECIGYDKVIYGDTDSLFYFSDDETDTKVLVLNSYKAMRAPKVKLKDGSMLNYDCFELEHKIRRMKALKSKVYAFETVDGDFEVTVGGMPKVGPDGITREQEVGSLENFDLDTKFYSCARTNLIWLDYGYAHYKQPYSTISTDIEGRG